MLAKHEPERELFDLGLMIKDAAKLLEAESHRCDMTSTCRGFKPTPWSWATPFSMEEVRINLTPTAIEAVADMPRDRRTVVI